LGTGAVNRGCSAPTATANRGCWALKGRSEGPLKDTPRVPLKNTQGAHLRDPVGRACWACYVMAATRARPTR
jgi:hypothetical protein